MIREITIENFLSYKEKTVISFKKEQRDSTNNHPNHSYDGYLRVPTFFGANGSGKSNIFYALYFISKLSTSDVSANHVINKICSLEPYKLHQNINENIAIAVSFLCDEKIYEYTIKLQGRKFIEESLASIGKKDGKRSDIYIRTDSTIKFPNIKEEQANPLKNVALAQGNTSSLYELGRNQSLDNKTYPILKDIRMVCKYFASIIFFNTEITKQFITAFDAPIDSIHFLNDKTSLGKINDILSSYDTGIVGIDTQEVSKEWVLSNSDIRDEELLNKILSNILDTIKDPSLEDTKVIFGKIIIRIDSDKNVSFKKIIFNYRGNNDETYPLDFDAQSVGTKKLFNLLILLLITDTDKDKVVVCGELENSLHSHILKNIIKKYVANQNNNQLILAGTHCSQLFSTDVLRKDEVFIVEKNNYGESQVKNLYKDFSTRNDKEIRRAFEAGYFGGVPRLF